MCRKLRESGTHVFEFFKIDFAVLVLITFLDKFHKMINSRSFNLKYEVRRQLKRR